VDWCEDHKVETIRTNVIGTLTLADLCFERGIHTTIYATGWYGSVDVWMHVRRSHHLPRSIFEYDADHVIGGVGFTEEDRPNFFASFYSKTKVRCQT
jgi:nucleoside-diphosphate-sugar epimerase